MPVRLTKVKMWEAKCPRCKNIAISNKSNKGCPNCHNKISLYTPYSDEGWQSKDAELSWRQIKCDKGCGWWINELDCPSCKAKIKGNYFIDKLDIYNSILKTALIIIVLSTLVIFFIITVAQELGII